MSVVGYYVRGSWRALKATARNLFRPVVTEGVRPHETRAERYRASFALVHDEHGDEACIGCMLCEKICPSDIITVKRGKKAESPNTGEKRGWCEDFTLDLQACIICELCVQVCPVDAIVMVREQEQPGYSREDLVLTMDKLYANETAKPLYWGTGSKLFEMQDPDRLMIARFLGRTKRRAQANRLYEACVEQAREPAFYASLGVPDTLDGRFDMIGVHVFLLLRRLKAEGEKGEAFAQTVFDAMFADMDRSLREMGVGDMGIGKRVRAMGKAFMGRIMAYDKALEGDEPLEDALARNLYRNTGQDAENLSWMAAYMRRQLKALEGQPAEALFQGEVVFDKAETQPGDAA